MLGLGNNPASEHLPEQSRGLEIFFIDVQGGAATLIITPQRESILIDSGWPGTEDRDPKRIVHALKDLAGCDHLDHLITTHWHMDHFGGVEGLSRLIAIGQFWDRGLARGPRCSQFAYPDGPSEGDPLGKAYRKASAGKRKSLKAGDLAAAQRAEGAGTGLRRRGGQAAPRRVILGALPRRPQPVCASLHRRISRSISRQRTEPGHPVLARPVPVLRRRRPDLERREKAGLPDSTWSGRSTSIR